jgi:hypothetical protein
MSGYNAFRPPYIYATETTRAGGTSIPAIPENREFNPPADTVVRHNPSRVSATGGGLDRISETTLRNRHMGEVTATGARNPVLWAQGVDRRIDVGIERNVIRNETGRRVEVELGHPTISSRRVGGQDRMMPARIGGELVSRGTHWEMNDDSGRYGRGRPFEALAAARRELVRQNPGLQVEARHTAAMTPPAFVTRRDAAYDSALQRSRSATRTRTNRSSESPQTASWRGSLRPTRDTGPGWRR